MKLSNVGANREGLNTTKISHFLSVLAGKTRNADAYLDKFADFNLEALRDLTGKRIANLLIDIDDCIAPAYEPILEENLEHIQRLREQSVNLAVYSNCQGSYRLRPLRDMHIWTYEGKIAKPGAQGFIEACQQNGFNPAETWMIGDNPITDGGAVGVLEGVAFVKPIEPSEEPNHLIPFSKRLKLPISRFFRSIALRYTLKGNNSILRSHDLKKRALELAA